MASSEWQEYLVSWSDGKDTRWWDGKVWNTDKSTAKTYYIESALFFMEVLETVIDGSVGTISVSLNPH